MDLYTLTFCGLFISIFLLLSLGSYLRRCFLAMASDWGKLNEDLKSKFDELQRSLDRIDRKLKGQESGYDPQDY